MENNRDLVRGKYRDTQDTCWDTTYYPGHLVDTEKNTTLSVVDSAPTYVVSRYFLPTRTQPFIVTFFQAIISFRRICRTMKVKLGFGVTKRAIRQGASLLRRTIQRSEYSRAKLISGVPLIDSVGEDTAEFSRKPYGGSNSLSRDFSSSVGPSDSNVHAPKDTSEIAQKVSEHIDHYFSTVLHAGSNYIPLSEKLKRRLRINKIDNGHVQHVELALAAPAAALKHPAAITSKPTPETHAASKRENEVEEFLPGTVIYFGATVALQARHGGYLSFYDASDIKASAHKVLPHSRFVIINAEDITDIGTLKYGDAVWLQAGQHEVLGAQFGGVHVTEKKRKIHPSLINYRRGNVFKAQQYGRWIVVNRDDPLGKVGRPVSHLDKMMLEQEWYFLASSTPYDSSMYKMKSIFDDNARAADLFNPGDECTWKLHLVTLPVSGIGDENIRMKLLKEAKNQIESSQEGRFKRRLDLFGTVSNMLREEEDAEAQQIHARLKHKMSSHQEQNQLMRLYHTLSVNDFEPKMMSPGRLRAIYGAGSTIAKFAEQSQSQGQRQQQGDRVSRGGSFDQNGPSSRHAKTSASHHRSLERMEDQYWNNAQKVLVDTLAFGELDSALNKYYSVDVLRKHTAAIKIQRFVRQHLVSVLLYERSMRALDCAAISRISNKNKARDEILKGLQNEKGSSSPERHHAHAATGRKTMSAHRKNNATTPGTLFASSSSASDDVRTLHHPRSHNYSNPGRQQQDLFRQRPSTAVPKSSSSGLVREGHATTPMRTIRPKSSLSINRPSSHHQLISDDCNIPRQKEINKPRVDIRIPIPDYMRPFPVHTSSRSRGGFSQPPVDSNRPQSQRPQHPLSHVETTQPKVKTSLLAENIRDTGRGDAQTAPVAPLITLVPELSVHHMEKLETDKGRSDISKQDNMQAGPVARVQVTGGIAGEQELETTNATVSTNRPAASSFDREVEAVASEHHQKEKWSGEHQKQKQKQAKSFHFGHNVEKKRAGTSAVAVDRHALGKSKTNPNGLPDDVFVDLQGDVSLTTGLQFLRSMATDPNLYIHVSRQERKGWMQTNGRGKK